VSYRFHPGAKTDLHDAIAFYVRQAGRSVAARFVDAVERAAELVAERPEIGRQTGEGRRSVPVRGFPYSLIYRQTDSEILILVVRHQNRSPKHGQDRK
jgi:toxin ParE1/3/4